MSKKSTAHSTVPEEYISLDQKFSEVEINHPNNIGVINLFLRNWRHHDRLQKHQEGNDNVKFYTMEDLKNSNDYSDVIPYLKKIERKQTSKANEIRYKTKHHKSKYQVCDAEV